MIKRNITLKQLAEFRRKGDKGKKSFAQRIQSPKLPSTGEGGDYWISCTSAIANAFKANSNQAILDKINQLNNDIKTATNAQTRNRHKQNLDILHKYTNFNVSSWAPTMPLTFLTRPKIILDINKMPVQVMPNHVFEFSLNGKKMVGGIWFVIWLDGFKPGDVDMYTEALYEYTLKVYGTTHKVDPDFCMTIDLILQSSLSYSQVRHSKIPSVLNSTLNELSKLVGP